MSGRKIIHIVLRKAIERGEIKPETLGQMHKDTTEESKRVTERNDDGGRERETRTTLKTTKNKNRGGKGEKGWVFSDSPGRKTAIVVVCL